jgi:hypothetical protein
MEQRRLRLGDILDDYCPRERRVTNHAVVAMIEEDVKQTRCTTCDAEHAYKGARVPARRKKETTAALYKEVLAGMPEADEAPLLAVPAAPVLSSLPAVPPVVTATPEPIADPAVEDTKPAIEGGRAVAAETSMPAEEVRAEADVAEDEAPAVDGPVHRPLIRAQLPRVEGQKEVRPAPDFTMRHTPSRGGNGGFRGDRDRMRMRSGGGNGSGNGNSYGQANGTRSGSGSRFQGNRGPGGGRPPMGRAGGPPSGFRGGSGNGNGNGNKRGRGSRG